jgi:superfamily II DNA or RNA helicase
MKGYIYLRSNQLFDLHNAYKMGKASNIPDRESVYMTSEVIRGNFELVLEIELNEMNLLEKLLQYKFSNLNIYINSGKEIFNKCIINLIEPYLQLKKIRYRKLDKNEIDNLVHKVRDKKIEIENKDSLIEIIENKFELINQSFNLKPREDQLEIIERSIKYFNEFDKGLLVLMCGVGKTLISLWITQKLNFKKIVIGVPNKLLLKQWQKVINLVFPDIPYLIVSGGIDVSYIEKFIGDNNDNCIIITTYASSYKVNKASIKKEFEFDMKINDEVHHLTSLKTNLDISLKDYIQMLLIKSKKQLSLTATLKYLEFNDNENIISNDNKDYFGEIIDKKNLLWAINKNVICDYLIQTIIFKEDKLQNEIDLLNINDDNNKRLFLSAYSALMSIYYKHSHHILIYSNNKTNSNKIMEYINFLIKKEYFQIPNLYYSGYHSEMNNKKQKEIIHNFQKSNNAIISCVYCLGEGWDFPLLDAVVFAENMTSNIRIVQSALRASRKDANNIHKKAKIILPILDKDDWLDNSQNTDLKKIKEVINQMSQEDENIIYKIKVFKINTTNEKNKSNNTNNLVDNNNIELGEYDSELTEKLKLKTIKRDDIYLTYDKAKKILATKDFKSKQEYFEYCKIDNRFTINPDLIFKSFNWIDYLSIKRNYYNIDLCKTKVIEYINLYPEIKKNNMDLLTATKKLCELDELFPPYDLWNEYYNITGLSQIFNINNFKKINGIK